MKMIASTDYTFQHRHLYFYFIISKSYILISIYLIDTFTKYFHFHRYYFYSKNIGRLISSMEVSVWTRGPPFYLIASIWYTKDVPIRQESSQKILLGDFWHHFTDLLQWKLLSEFIPYCILPEHWMMDDLVIISLQYVHVLGEIMGI